jgi:hypothetical protein
MVNVLQANLRWLEWFEICTDCRVPVRDVDQWLPRYVAQLECTMGDEGDLLNSIDPQNYCLLLITF